MMIPPHDTFLKMSFDRKKRDVEAVKATANSKTTLLGTTSSTETLDADFVTIQEHAVPQASVQAVKAPAHDFFPAEIFDCVSNEMAIMRRPLLRGCDGAGSRATPVHGRACVCVRARRFG